MFGIMRTLALVISAGIFSSVLTSPASSSQDFESIFAPRGNAESSSHVEHTDDAKTTSHHVHSTYAKYPGRAESGTIEVHTKERALYFVTDGGRTVRYRVGVGRMGQQWFGRTKIADKRLRPAWTPPAVIRGNKPAWVAPPGAPNNPMGAAALVLADHELAIHGTNDPSSIGGYVSWGCIRMHNRDILDLYSRVSVGTPVVIKR
jgi:lipoprotein-anchoring transpeptidase ErfK/SrfK